VPVPIPPLVQPLSPDPSPRYDYYEPSPDYDHTGQVRWPPVVSFSGRQWSGLLAAYGQFLLAIDTASYWWHRALSVDIAHTSE